MTNENKLTPRELEILKLLAKEHTSKEIAEMLGISNSTIDGYRKRICMKLGVKTSIGAVVRGIKMGLIEV